MNMNEQRIAQSIRQWHERVVELETRYNELSPLIGANPESLMMAAVWHVASGYTDMTGEATGAGGWLEWWWLECNLGARQMTACLPGEPQRNIATLEDLIRLVLDDLRRAQCS